MKYEQIFYGDVIRIFQEFSPITWSSSSVLIISVCSTWMFELDFDLVCCRTSIRHETYKIYARYEHNLCLALFSYSRGLNEFFLLQRGGAYWKGQN